jgi:hypothetical protein
MIGLQPSTYRRKWEYSLSVVLVKLKYNKKTHMHKRDVLVESEWCSKKVATKRHRFLSCFFSAMIQIVNPNLGSWFKSKDSNKNVFMSCPDTC